MLPALSPLQTLTRLPPALAAATVCVEAPRGTFVNRTGATFAVPW